MESFTVNITFKFGTSNRSTQTQTARGTGLPVNPAASVNNSWLS